MCQAIFNRIWIHEDGTVTTEFTDIYKNIVGPIERDLINQNIKSASAETDADFIDKLLKSYSNFFGQGLNNELLSFVAEKDTAWKALRLNGFRVLRNLCFCFSALFSSHFRTPI